MCLAENLRRLRKGKSLTQTELAELTGVSCNSIINYENGRRTDPPLSVLRNLAAGLGVSIDRLVGDGCYLEERKKMKLWKLMADIKPGISGMDLKQMMRNVADRCGAPGMTTRTTLRNLTQIAFIIADDHVTTQDLYDAWKFECRCRTGNEEDPACVVTMISKDTDAETLARHYGMREDDAREMLREAYPVVLPKEEADQRGLKGMGFKFHVKVEGVEEVTAHLKELNDLLEKAQALAANLTEKLGGLEITVERV